MGERRTVSRAARSSPVVRRAQPERQLAGDAGGAVEPIALGRVAPQLQRAADGDADTDAMPAGLVVDDDVQTLTTGQMHKSELLALLKAEACAAADRELARVGRDTDGCPHVQRWLDYYQDRDASQLERAIRRFAPGAAEARTARDYVPLVSARIAAGVAAWVVTGQLPGDVPPELTAAAIGGSGLLGGVLALGAGIGGAASAIGRLLFAAAPGGARSGVDRAALSSQLGPGASLDSGARTRMEAAFGHSFANVRVHADDAAAALSRDVGAHAFTLGEHVAFAGGRYRPGTPAGDALLAHELAHVVQQTGPATAAASDRAIEHDADRAAAGAVMALYASDEASNEASRERRKPSLRSGLRLSRCTEEPKAPPEAAPPNKAGPDAGPAKPAVPEVMAPGFARPDEKTPTGGDKFARQTLRVVSDDKIVFTPAPENGKPPPTPQTIDKEFGVFVPAGAARNPDVNKVQIFFTPFVGPGGHPSDFLIQQGLRSQTDASEWITIAAPARDEGDTPNWVTISTADIAKCLATAGRKTTTIDTIRLTAHSRGHRGLEHTIGFQAPGAKSPPTIDLGKVDRVSVFDASYRDLGEALRTHEKDLTRMQDPKDPKKFAAGSIRLYDVTVGNISGFPGVNMTGSKLLSKGPPEVREFAIQGVVYLRAFLEGALGMRALDPAPPPAPDPFADVKRAAIALLPKIPARGRFSTRTPTPPGMTDLPSFLTANQSDLFILGRDRNGLKQLLSDLGVETGMSWGLDAHHFLAAELGHEVVE